MSDRSPRILLSSTLFAPFIEEDFLLLSRHFTVERLTAHGFKALRKLPGAVFRADVTFTWFGSVYAGITVFVARRLRKKSIVIVGGVDASKEREIQYGIWLHPVKASFVRYAFRHADRLLVVDPFFAKEVVRLAEYGGENITVVPTGYDAHRWLPGGQKEEMVLTVASCENEWRMKKKGLYKLFAAARELPAVRFCVIGIHERLLANIRSLLPGNVEAIPYIPRDDILPYFQRAKVYCQPSYTEGLPNSLCEAMLCECIPVGTAVGGIPTAIGDTGYLVPMGNHAALVEALRAAMGSPVAKGAAARRRIVQEFTLEKRERALLAVISELAP